MTANWQQEVVSAAAAAKVAASHTFLFTGGTVLFFGKVQTQEDF